jgi:hypothetical protein
MRTTHLVDLRLVHLLSPPLLSLNLLCVSLPFCEETDLCLCQSSLFHCSDLTWSKAYFSCRGSLQCELGCQRLCVL